MYQRGGGGGGGGGRRRVALVGNCFGGMFAQQVEHKFVKRRLLLAVLDEVPTLMNQGKRLCSPNLSQALFMLVCLERLLNRDGAKRLKDGSTLTMALGGTIVFRKFFSTGPARQVIQERSGEAGGGKKGGKKSKGRSAAAEGGWLDPTASAGAGAGVAKGRERMVRLSVFTEDPTRVLDTLALKDVLVDVNTIKSAAFDDSKGAGASRAGGAGPARASAAGRGGGGGRPVPLLFPMSYLERNHDAVAGPPPLWGREVNLVGAYGAGLSDDDPQGTLILGEEGERGYVAKLAMTHAEVGWHLGKSEDIAVASTQKSATGGAAASGGGGGDGGGGGAAAAAAGESKSATSSSPSSSSLASVSGFVSNGVELMDGHVTLAFRPSEERLSELSRLVSLADKEQLGDEEYSRRRYMSQVKGQTGAATELSSPGALRVQFPVIIVVSTTPFQLHGSTPTRVAPAAVSRGTASRKRVPDCVSSSWAAVAAADQSSSPPSSPQAAAAARKGTGSQQEAEEVPRGQRLSFLATDPGDNSGGIWGVPGVHVTLCTTKREGPGGDALPPVTSKLVFKELIDRTPPEAAATFARMERDGYCAAAAGTYWPQFLANLEGGGRTSFPVILPPAGHRRDKPGRTLHVCFRLLQNPIEFEGHVRMNVVVARD